MSIDRLATIISVLFVYLWYYGNVRFLTKLGLFTEFKILIYKFFKLLIAGHY